MPSPPPERRFLDWSRPLLSAAVEELWRGRPAGTVDLSSWAIVVPSSSAARRLRGALAERASVDGGGVLAPLVLTPEAVVRWGLPEGAEPASRAETIPAWAATLLEMDPEETRALFPVEPVSRDLAWALRAAAELLRLRHTLEESARSAADAARDLSGHTPEPERWETLARVEALASERMEAASRRDSLTLRVHAAAEARAPEGIAEVWVIGVPDSAPLVRGALHSVRRNGTPVTVCIHAPESMAHTFDEWGRPIPAVWTKREIHIPDAEKNIRLLPGPAEQAAAILEEIKNARHTPGALATGSADPEIAAELLDQAGRERVDVFDPEGLPLARHELYQLLALLTGYLRGQPFGAAGRLLRQPAVLAAAKRDAAYHFSETELLRVWDEFQAERMPRSVPAALPLAEDHANAAYQRALDKLQGGEETPKRSPVPALLRWLMEMARGFSSQPVSQALTEWLEMLFGDRKFASPPERNRFLIALDTLLETLAQAERGADAFTPDMDAAARLDLALTLARDAHLYSENDGSAAELHGWLELPWRDEPDLIVAGMNEGMAPESVVSDAWLPDGARAVLDLKTNDTRLARDSYLLTAMIESRKGAGRVQLLAGRAASGGDPLKPGRLLLRCPEAELPARALRLFAEPREEENRAAMPPSWHRAWVLTPPAPPRDAPVFQRMSVTAFSDYLACPFRFYLKHGLGMREYDAAKTEMDARDFGGLFHDSMQALHEHEDLKDSENADAVAAFLRQTAAEIARRKWGADLTVPLAMQLESAQNRLSAVARVHTAERAAGWRCESVEISFPNLPNSTEPVKIDGMEIRGRIDLIERQKDTGALRVLDYKTSAKPKQPREAHLKNMTRSKTELDLPDWQLPVIGGKPHRWTNLQLPLYARIVGSHYGQNVAVGYINAPLAVSQTALAMWEDVDEATLESAWQCAVGAVRAIRAGRFFPPAEKVEYDDFARLGFRDFAESFDLRLLEKFAELRGAEAKDR